MRSGRQTTTAGTLAVLAAVTLGAGACAQEAGNTFATVGRSADFAATPEYLASVIDESQATSYRYEVSMDWEMMGRSVTPDGPLVTGATDGERSEMHMDFGAMFDTMAEEFAGDEDTEFPEEIFGGDMTMEMVNDESTVYVRAPFLAAMGELAPSSDFDGLPAGELDDLFGDGWVKIDLSALGDMAASEVGPLVGGGQSTDPTIFLDILQQADAVEELEADTIDGEPVTGLSASVGVDEMLDAQDMSLDEAAAEEDVPDEMLDMLDELQYDIEVWVDGDDHVRRVVLDMGAMIEQIAEETGEDLPSGGMQFRMTIDFFDYGDESIAVEFPEDATDVTEDFAEVLETLPGN